MPTTTRAKLFTSVVLAATCISLHADDWKVDFSRRTQSIRKQDLRAPASVSGEFPVDVETQTWTTPGQQQQQQQQQPNFFQTLFQSNDIAQEIVVLNTEKGFVPSTIRVKKGMNYQIHIVNVNDKEKNVSFVLDSFSEHHATFYGKIKTFVIRPQKEGVFRFVSPETSAQGKLVVFPAQQGAENRMPASAE